MTPPRTRDAEATQAQILAAAAEIFAARGFADASLSGIARAAGVTKSLIHHHFGSKEGLWEAIKERHFGEYFETQMQMLGGPSDEDLLRRSVEAYFRFLQRHPEFVRMIGWMQLEQQGEVEFEAARTLTEAGIGKIREAQEAGLLRADVHPFSILISFLGLAEHWFQGKATHCEGLGPDDGVTDDEHYLRDMMTIFFEGVVPRPASAGGND